MRSSYKAFDGEGGTSAGGYVGRVMLTGIPKLAIIVRLSIFAIVIAISYTFLWCKIVDLVRTYAHSNNCTCNTWQPVMATFL